tara:strand:- start:258 stop:698 length:441 start_codon:yes stop_codon:yes gene_type:complete
MEELKKYKKKLELRGSKLVNENPRTDSVVYIFLKSFKIDYNPNRLKDKQFKKVYTSIKENGYLPKKHNYITVLRDGGIVLDGKKRIKALRLTGRGPQTKVPVKLVKTVGIEEEIPTLKDVHVGVLLIFMFATLISILIGSILNLFL